MTFYSLACNWAMLYEPCVWHSRASRAKFKSGMMRHIGHTEWPEFLNKNSSGCARQVGRLLLPQPLRLNRVLCSQLAASGFNVGARMGLNNLFVSTHGGRPMWQSLHVCGCKCVCGELGFGPTLGPWVHVVAKSTEPVSVLNTVLHGVW